MPAERSAGPWPPSAPRLSPALRLEVDLGPIQELGEIEGRRRRIIPILGGRVSGERLCGVVLPGGADWQSVRLCDGLTRLHARYWLLLDDGARVSVENLGLRRAAPENTARLLTGEPVDPGDYYFRTTPRFAVVEGPHGWLNESVFVGSGVREAERVVIDVYLVG